MNLSSKNLLVMYHVWLYNLYPRDLCSFFWTSLFSIICAPLLIPGVLLEKVFNDPDSLGTRVFKSILYILLFLMTVILVYGFVNDISNLYYPFDWIILEVPIIPQIIMMIFFYTIFLLCLATVLTIAGFSVYGAIAGTVSLSNYLANKSVKTNDGGIIKKKRKWLLIEYIKAVKNKYCPTIFIVEETPEGLA